MRYLYGKNYHIYRRNLAQAVDHLAQLDNELRRVSPGAARASIRIMTDIPPFSLIIVEKKDEKVSFLQVQLNFLYTRVGRSRPMFIVDRDAPWNQRFVDEFDALWSGGHTQAVSINELQLRINRLDNMRYTDGEEGL